MGVLSLCCDPLRLPIDRGLVKLSEPLRRESAAEPVDCCGIPSAETGSSVVRVASRQDIGDGLADDAFLSRCPQTQLERGSPDGFARPPPVVEALRSPRLDPCTEPLRDVVDGLPQDALPFGCGLSRRDLRPYPLLSPA